MEVNFAQITATADKRRQALEALGALVDQAPAQAARLAEVSDYAAQLQAAWGALDAEGRTLLPKGLQLALSRIYAGNYRSLLKDSTMATNCKSEPIGLLVVACFAAPEPTAAPEPEPEPESDRFNW